MPADKSSVRWDVQLAGGQTIVPRALSAQIPHSTKPRLLQARGSCQWYGDTRGAVTVAR